MLRYAGGAMEGSDGSVNVLIQGLTTAKFTLQVTRTAASVLTASDADPGDGDFANAMSASSERKDEDDDDGAGDANGAEVKKLVQRIDQQMGEIRRTLASGGGDGGGGSKAGSADGAPAEPAPPPSRGSKPAEKATGFDVAKMDRMAKNRPSLEMLGNGDDGRYSDLSLERDSKNVVLQHQLRKRGQMREASTARLAAYPNTSNKAAYLLVRSRARAAFEYIDVNHDGRLDVHEILELFHQLTLATDGNTAECLTIETIQEMMNDIDSVRARAPGARAAPAAAPPTAAPQSAVYRRRRRDRLLLFSRRRGPPFAASDPIVVGAIVSSERLSRSVALLTYRIRTRMERNRRRTATARSTSMSSAHCSPSTSPRTRPSTWRRATTRPTRPRPASARRAGRARPT